MLVISINMRVIENVVKLPPVMEVSSSAVWVNHTLQLMYKHPTVPVVITISNTTLKNKRYNYT